MITRIEIDGFKSFYDFSVDLQPLTVLIGANGSGKSNLFDAIKLLSHLADGDRVAVALNKIRGGAREAFALKADGTRYDSMRFAVEMLVDREVRDDLGGVSEIATRRLRYYLRIGDVFGESGNPSVHYERLTNLDSHSPVLIAGQVEVDYLLDHMDNLHDLVDVTDSGTLKGGNTPQRTLISNENTVSQAVKLSARREMQSWRTLYLIPDRLREPSKASELYDDSTIEANGANLPNMIERMRRADERALRDINLTMGSAIPGFHGVQVVRSEIEDKLALRITTTDHQEYWADSISDGTLRMLAYAALRNDDRLRGVLCIEEPENGVSPLRLTRLVELLRETATDFSNEIDANYPLRQVILSSHSPALARLVPPESIRLAVMPVSNPRPTRMFSILPEAHEDLGIRKYVQAEYEAFLNPSAEPAEVL